MIESKVKTIGPVSFPAWTGERVYMRPFKQRDGLPFDLARWQPTVNQMLQGVETDGPIYLMVDQAAVAAGATHRRPGVHVDGYWHPALTAHDYRGGHRSDPERHHARPDREQHRPGPRHGASAAGGHWSGATFTEPEAIILASDVAGCRAFTGLWAGDVGNGGDCSAIRLDGLSELPMRPGVAYAGNAGMLHESLPLPEACRRTVVRLNVPGWTP